MRALAVEWAPAFTVNAVAPGFTQKDPGAHAALDARAVRTAALVRYPAGRSRTIAMVLGFGSPVTAADRASGARLVAAAQDDTAEQLAGYAAQPVG